MTKKAKVKHHVFLSPIGNIRTRPTDDPSIDRLLDYVTGGTPTSVCAVAADRRVLVSLYENRSILFHPDARVKIYNALISSRTPEPPILAPTDYELVGWIEDLKKLTTISGHQPKKPADHKGLWPSFAPEKTYAFRYQALTFTSHFPRPKMESREATGETYVEEHDIQLRGKDSSYLVKDENGQWFSFRDNPSTNNHLPSEWVWKFFERPHVKTISETRKEDYQYALGIIEDSEMLNGISCYPGQKHYVASVSCTKGAVAAAETGAGKSFMAILLDQINGGSHTLLIAPKGTVKDANGDEAEYDPAQWVAEFEQFSPDRQVFPLFSMKDYESIIRTHKRLPPGVYITYPQTFFTGGGAFEHIPKSWPRRDYEEKFRNRFGYKWDEDNPPVPAEYMSEGIGETRNGISCIYKPSMATQIGHMFDMVILDEAHLICNPDAIVSKSLAKLQPKFRYCLTATPIPNIVTNIFHIIGWVAVHNWYRGNLTSSRWPFRYGEHGRFNAWFTSKERDLTEERKRAERGESSTAKISPILSQPQRLLKIIKSSVAFISKKDCNPDLVKCEVNTIRVPFGEQQMKLYAHNLQIKNIPFKNPKTKYGVQMMRLRGICGDPKGRKYSDVTSNMNPKMLATLEKIAECLEEGEQVIHVAAFQGQNAEIAARLDEAGVPYSLIDATTGARHASEANAFKRGDTKVLLMGIKCAQAHSFKDCKYLIIGSLEWSYGSFNQATGRIFRLNSPNDVEVFVILHKDSIEEMMFDRLATKRDAATICLHGKPIPRDFKSVTAAEVFAEHFTSFDEDASTENESYNEANEWLPLKNKLEAYSGSNLRLLEAT